MGRIQEDSMKLFGLVAITGLMVGITAVSGARAADPEFCRDYARVAVEQARRAENTPHCGHLLREARFSTEFRAHFDWCLGAHRREADDERARRHEALERCAFR